MENLHADQRLAPGLRVVRRGTDLLQVGLHPQRRLVLPHTPASERALDALLDGAPLEPDDLAAAVVVQRLQQAGLTTSRSSPDTARRVGLRCSLPSLPGTSPARLLTAAGLRVTTDLLDADAVLVLSESELARDSLDPLVRAAVPHLMVRLVDGLAVLGPFVAPGRTACLRCVDAHLAVADPHHAAVVTRYVEATARPRADDGDDPDPALVACAAAWAVRDVRAHLCGSRPSTWSTTVTLGHEPGQVDHTSWRPHPECGCSWPVEFAPSGRMEDMSSHRGRAS